MKLRISPLLLSSFLLVACSDDDPQEAAPPVTDIDAGTDAADESDADVDADTDADSDADTDADTDADAGGVCGDGVVDEGEECDLGDENAEDGNCLLDCTWNTEQSWDVSFDEVVAEVPFDGSGVTVDDAPLGTGAWGTSDEDVNDDGLVKFELNFDPTYKPFDFVGPIKLGDIAEIAYYTKKPGGPKAGDFYLVIYTKKEPGSLNFYGHRITALPKQARELDAPADTWNRWSTKEGPNQLTFADQPVIGTFSGSTLPTLDELTAGAFDWSEAVESAPETSIDYANKEIFYFSIQTGSGTETSEFEGLLDAITLELKDGRKVTVDLEP